MPDTLQLELGIITLKEYYLNPRVRVPAKQIAYREQVNIDIKNQSTETLVSNAGHRRVTTNLQAVFRHPGKIVEVEYGGYALIRTGDPIIMSDVL